MAEQVIHSLISTLNANIENMFTRKIRTYNNVTIPSSGYIAIDSYSEMEVNTNLYLISMNIRGWTGDVHGITLAKGSSGRDLYLLGNANTTIQSITVEYLFSAY